ncbi:MAG: Ni/Fe-hydrogenase cytochrome b subunit [bacterium]
MKRSNVIKNILWVLVGMAIVVAVARFTRGLGATTNLSDSTPWGFWIGFDVMAGVALAAGGFVLAAAVYIFRIERLRPFLRAAVLTAFLGYVAVAVGLLFDLGIPWNIWHPMIYWQYQSVLFEVAMCVMLYLTVLGLEFAPVALEHKLFQRGPFLRIYHVLKALTIPLVILGIMLSTLHQSSLGSLFVIMPHRVHPLWYSPGMMLPVNFFVSAVALGFMMVTFEHFVSAWMYKHEPRRNALSSLALAASMVLGLYVVLRVGDLFYRGVLPGAMDGSWQSFMFIFEIGISAVIPAILLGVPRLRKSGKALFTAALMVVIGMVLYRLDIAIITVEKWPGMSYFPSAVEFMVSIGIVSAMALIFIYFVENLNVFPEAMAEGEKRELETADDVIEQSEKPPRGIVTGTVELFLKRWYINEDPFQKPKLSETTRTWLGDPLQAGIRKYSMIVVLAIAATAAILPVESIFGFRPDRTEVISARLDKETRGEFMLIDGNLAGESVQFNHEKHVEEAGGKEGCVKCHHMSLPKAFASSCAQCHSDMYLQTSIFDHDMHQDEFGGNDGCIECHPQDKAPENAKSCVECHADMWPEAAESEKVDYQALSYKEAMHENCISCHEEKAVEKNKPDLPLCTTCHQHKPRVE